MVMPTCMSHRSHLWATETKFWSFLWKVNLSEGFAVVWVSWALLSQGHLSKAHGRINPIRILSLLLSYGWWLDHTQRQPLALEPAFGPWHFPPLPEVTGFSFFPTKNKTLLETMAIQRKVTCSKSKDIDSFLYLIELSVPMSLYLP